MESESWTRLSDFHFPCEYLHCWVHGHESRSSSSSLTQFVFSPLVFPIIRVFSSELTLCIRWPKYWSFSFSISPSNEYSRLISFRIDWFDLLVVQGILKSLLQHHILKASILWCSAFFMVQLSCPYMTTGDAIAASHNVYLCVCVCVS